MNTHRISYVEVMAHLARILVQLGIRPSWLEWETGPPFPPIPLA
ncbi:MAG: hypothetical protein PVG22_15955 [Chromatiales bacterium]|jgi:hypothetical protein